MQRQTKTTLTEGDGDELGKEGGPSKARALHSSAILACNVFDYWRGRDLGTLATVFGTALCGLRLEGRFRTGMRGKAPNIDVVLYEWGGGLFGIESKFTELFRKSKLKGFLRPKYFESSDTWSRVGLAGCQHVADELRANPSQFELLDVAQLLKHMLVLASGGSTWKLCCLWYRPTGALGDEHSNEINHFRDRLGPDASRFFSMTYQDMVARFSGLLGPEHSEYLTYLEDRYFGAVAWPR